jgi:hypothetical protein
VQGGKKKQGGGGEGPGLWDVGLHHCAACGCGRLGGTAVKCGWWLGFRGDFFDDSM